MIRRTLSVVAALVCTAAVVAPATAGGSQPPTELMGNGPTPIPLKDKAMISKSDWGLRYRAGQQDSRLTVTVDGNTVRYVDTGTREWRSMPKLCRAERVDKGVAATCRFPARYRDGRTMYLEIWPRLGDDFVDGSSLPAHIRLWTLADAGFDRVYGGAGDDFVNGAQDDDVIRGGAGDDWLRGGANDDDVSGDDGDDYLTAIDGRDTMRGGEGADKIYGGDHADQLWGGGGADSVSCGNGRDTGTVDDSDKVRGCERTAPEAE